MLSSRLTLVLKGAFADRLVVATAFVVVLLSTTLVAAIPIYADAVAQSSLRERLERAPETEANVQATVNLFGGVSERPVDSRVTTIAQDVFGATHVTIVRNGESEPFSAGGRTVAFGFFDEIARHARMVAGRWPRSGAGPVEVAVPLGAARNLDLRVGRLVRTRSRLDEGQVVQARVVGLYRPERPSSAYWWGNPLAARASGPLATTRQSFFALDFEDVELRWRMHPDLRRLTVDDAALLRRRLASMPGRLNAGRETGQQFELDTNLPDILAGADRSLRLARAGVLVPSIQLALLAAYGLIVTAALLIDRRRRTTESLRLRGASTAGLVGMAVLEASLIAIPAVLVAPWLAAGLLHALNHVGPLTGIGLRLEPRVSQASYALAAAAGAVCVAGLVLPALWARRAAILRDRGRLPVAHIAHRMRLDLVLAALALLGYWQLRRYHGVLLSNRGSLDVDPFLVAAPALLLLAGALLSLRLVPLAAALVERVLPSTQGVVGALGFWQLARRPRAYARSVLLLVLAVAIGVFAATYSRTWHRSQIDQAQHAAGADVLVEPSQAPGTPPMIELSSAYRTLGIEDALPGATSSFDLARSGVESGELLALDAGRAGAVAGVRDDFASQPMEELLRPLAERRADLAALALPGRPTRLALSVQLLARSARPPPAPEVLRRHSSRSVFLTLRDADGLLHAYRLGELRPRRPERFELELAHRLPAGGLARPRYPLELVAIQAEVEVPYLASRRMTLVVRSLEVGTRAAGRMQRVQLGERRWRASATGVDLPYERPRVGTVSTAGGSIRVPVSTGAYLFRDETAATTEVNLRSGRDSIPSAPPVLVSDSYLDATHAEVGQLVPLAVASGTQTMRIAGSFHRFPTLEPDVPAVVADLPTYVAIAYAAEGEVVQPTHWWVRTVGDAEAARQLRAPPFRSLGVVSRNERERALLEDPIPLGVIGALALGFVVAAAFAAVGFAASAAAAARARMVEFAVLRSLGLRTRQLSGWIGIESGLVVLLSLLAGTALGLLVSWLVLPYVALGTSGAVPVPPVRVSVPWGLVFWLEAALLGALVTIAALQVARIRALRPAPILRSGEGAPAS
jgi:FtsX-like permease family